MRPLGHASANPSRSIDSSAPTARPAGAIVVRLGWMLAGNLAMLISVMMIASQPRWMFSLWDGIFWGAVVLTGALRYCDIARLRGETTSGAPATAADLRRYLVGLAALSVAGWLGAQAIHL